MLKPIGINADIYYTYSMSMTQTSTVSNPSASARTGVLARLLASENIRVVHDASVPSAAFDLKTRTLILPMWKCEKVVYDFLVGHEVAHAKYTPADRWRAEAERIGGTANAKIAQDYINVIEDARIERLIKREFPGLRQDFMQGYKTLSEMDIFQIKGKDLSTLSLIDRINLYYKVGIHCGVQVPFTDDERKILDRISNTRAGEIGFDDVVKIAEELFNAAKEENKPQQGGKKDKSKGGKREEEQQSDQYEDGESNESEDGEDDQDSQGNGNGTDDQDGEGETEGKPQDKKGEEKGDKSDKSQDDGDESEDIGESAEDDTDDGESAESEFSNDASDADGKETDVEITDAEYVPGEVTTSGSMSRGLEKFVDSSTVEQVITIRNIDPTKIVVGVNDFIDLVDNNIAYATHYSPNRKDNKGTAEVKAIIEERAAKIFKIVCDQNSRNVDLMCKRFDVKRSARNFAKQTSAKSGRISTRLLSKYKFSEDIFDRITIKNDEKNHGIVILVDWSGSIGGMISETAAQVCTLLMFCRRAGIAAEVYFFTTSHCPIADKWFKDENPDAAKKGVYRSDYVNYGYGSNGTKDAKWSMQGEMERFTDHVCNLPEGTAAKGEVAIFQPFSLVKVYEQGMNNKQFSRAIGRFLLLANIVGTSRHNEEVRGLVADHMLSLGGTPLDESILAMREIVKNFRKSSNTKVTLINLTDGEGQSVIRKVKEKAVTGKQRLVQAVIDDATGRRFEQERGSWDMHSDIMTMFREGTGVQAVGIFLTKGSYGSPDRCSVFQKALASTPGMYAKSDRYGYPQITAAGLKAQEDANKSYKSDSYCAFEYKPYDMYFIVNLPDRATNDREIAMQERKASTMKNQKVAATKVFIAKMKAEETNRMFINRLMDVIA